VLACKSASWPANLVWLSGSQTFMICVPLPKTLNTCGPCSSTKIPIFAISRQSNLIKASSRGPRRTAPWIPRGGEGPVETLWPSCWVGLPPITRAECYSLPSLVSNRRLFQKLYWPTLLRRTYAFLLLSSDYNVSSAKVIAHNNLIRCSHCQVVQLFRLKSLLIKPFTSIISYD